MSHWANDFQFSAWGQVSTKGRKNTASRDGLALAMLRGAGLKIKQSRTGRWSIKTKDLKRVGVSEQGAGCGMGRCDHSWDVRSCSVAMRMKKAAAAYARKTHASAPSWVTVRTSDQRYDTKKITKCPRGGALKRKSATSVAAGKAARWKRFKAAARACKGKKKAAFNACLRKKLKKG